ncbi:hypothetical protein ACOMHN_042690 [Nucella lapillus]
MSFHPQKCTTVHMTTSRTTAEREYQLHGHKLQEETQVKYLGVTLKKDLKTTYRQMSLFPRTIPEWNLLPAETATAPSLASFQARVAHLK